MLKEQHKQITTVPSEDIDIIYWCPNEKEQVEVKPNDYFWEFSMEYGVICVVFPCELCHKQHILYLTSAKGDQS